MRRSIATAAFAAVVIATLSGCAGEEPAKVTEEANGASVVQEDDSAQVADDEEAEPESEAGDDSAADTAELGETVSVQQGFGIALVLAGVLLAIGAGKPRQDGRRHGSADGASPSGRLAALGVALGAEERAKPFDLPFQGFGHGGSRRSKGQGGSSGDGTAQR